MTLDTAPPHLNYADPALHAHGLWIGGQWLPGTGISVINPSTGLELAEVADAGIADAMAAVDAAEAAAPGWPLASRARQPPMRFSIPSVP